MAPPHITWVEENFELADPENFVVTIGPAQHEPEDDGIPRG